MSDYIPYDERQLCLRIAEGDENAFREIFNAYRAKLNTYIIRITNSAELAEDTVHDVFLKLWVGRSKLAEIQDLNAYIFRMAHNHAINGLRKMATHNLVMSELDGSNQLNPDDPDHHLARKEVQKFIAEAVAQLTLQQKLVYQLSKEQGAPEGIMVKETIPYRTDSTAGIRFINLARSTNSKAINITLSTSTGVNEVSALAYKNMTDFKTYPGLYNSAYTFQIRNDTSAAPKAALATFALTAAQVPRFANITLVIRQNGTNGFAVFRVKNDR